MDVESRMFALVDAKFPEQKDFAAAIGVKAPRVSEWRRGLSKSYNKYLPQIAAVLDTSAEYLLTGSEPAAKKEPHPPKGTGLPEKYDRLTPEQQALVKQLIEQLAGDQ